ncbi:MAG: RNA pseudouridine synthase [endosymbiont of Galathealinum brachiosum]|uniref:RNA pseudouridine synthase n=1 Tax=endosymbiont of Galathealinum brachiosum TaxID=2200906 RepID=A0A370DC31_9GAMM|nr:MAG: RNA pseudouridine synthase [endosymbiont of Galathealinum brachiosum]
MNKTVKFEKHIKAEKNTQTILECLSASLEFSNQQIKKILQNGAVWLENSHGINRVRRAKKTINQGEILHVYFNAEIQASQPHEAMLIADEGDYSIWNKPGGMYSQGTKWGDHCTVYRWAEQNLMPQRQAFIVHRLDKAANGLIIIAHKKSTAAKLSAMFEKRQIHKKYRAIVEGILNDVELPYEIKNELDNKIAISEIISLIPDYEKQRTAVEIRIKTGRKHQIRRHLSEMGYPIIGDRLYGAQDIESDLQLSSIELEFSCPVSEKQKKYELPL